MRPAAHRAGERGRCETACIRRMRRIILVGSAPQCDVASRTRRAASREPPAAADRAALRTVDAARRVLRLAADAAAPSMRARRPRKREAGVRPRCLATATTARKARSGSKTTRPASTAAPLPTTTQPSGAAEWEVAASLSNSACISSTSGVLAVSKTCANQRALARAQGFRRPNGTGAETPRGARAARDGRARLRGSSSIRTALARMSERPGSIRAAPSARGTSTPRRNCRSRGSPARAAYA